MEHIIGVPEEPWVKTERLFHCNIIFFYNLENSNLGARTITICDA